jgi:hypothetical protein
MVTLNPSEFGSVMSRVTGKQQPSDPNQFKLFYGAQELQNHITESIDQEKGETLPQMWDRKVAESKTEDGVTHGSGVYRSMAEHGWQKSKDVVQGAEGELGRPNDRGLTVNHHAEPGRPGAHLLGGHHRVAALADIERTTGRDQWIPVNNVALTGNNLYKPPQLKADDEDDM